MNCEQIAQFARDQGQHLVHQNLPAFLQILETPLPIYTPDRMVLLQDPQDLVPTLETLTQQMKSLDVARLEPWKIRIVDQTGSRAVVQVRWEYLDARGKTRAVSVLQYVLRDPGSGQPFKVEMIDCQKISFPQALRTLEDITYH